MTISELIIIMLSLFGMALLMIRILMCVETRDRSKKKQSIRWDTGASKTIGDRELQEDEYGITEAEKGILAVLADGQGKEYGGKIAGRLAVQVFQDLFEDRAAFYNPHYYFRKAFQAANHEILKELDEGQGSASVGAVLIKDKLLYYAVVGNVKVAVYRNRELVPVSLGHTISVLAQQKYQEGSLTKQETAALLEYHRLYNFVGQDGFHDVEFFDTPITLRGGEYVVLMSDGIYETARWKDIEDCLEKEGSCQQKAFRIVELVNESQKEEKDNASVVVIKV